RDIQGRARLHERANDSLEAGEHQVALELIGAGAVADGIEELAFTLVAPSLRADVRQAVLGADDRPCRTRRAQEMKVEVPRQFLAPRAAADTVAARIEGG